MTNFERIKQMSIDELAEIIMCPNDWDKNCNIGCDPHLVGCLACTKHYLESEATDENNNL